MADSSGIEETATAPEVPSKKAAAPERLGRYRIEGMIGEGGMGVVYAALDPDLERRVALKVLRTETQSEEARARLLREARAMARLQHPNVVMVHEVGTAGDRDFVAMELVEGESLADWLKAERRGKMEILDAFLAAGRGLAAAHAAGVVHRDFKPHNVLIGKHGRVQVTDFGLARGVDAPRADPLAQTLPPGARRVDDVAKTPSSLSGLTSTGLVLGTPAYMAPEQWIGGAVGPATDQFAFCVALWEALAGQRPFGGTTEEELRVEVMRGRLALDPSKLPRRLRSLLVRGLEPRPAQRWPSMDALLAKLRRAERRPLYAGLAAVAVVAAGAAAFVLTRGSADACRAPARAPETVWSGGGAGELGAAFDRDVAAWTAARAGACEAGVESGAQLTCLDGALARLDAVVQAARSRSPPPESLARELVDPEVCRRHDPPHLVLAPSRDLIAALAVRAQVRDADEPDRARLASLALAIADRERIDPCARAIALLAAAAGATDVAAHRADHAEAMAAAEQCGDDHLRATAAIDVARFELDDPALEAAAEVARRAAATAIDRIPQADLVAARELDEARTLPADRADEALALAAKAIDGLAKRGGKRAQLDAVVLRTGLHLRRGLPADVEAIRTETPPWLPLARDSRAFYLLVSSDAISKFVLGDVAGCHAELEQLRARLPHTGVARVDGVVVDRDGHPIAGATVATSPALVVDPIGVVPFGPGTELLTTTTDTAGAFAFDGAPAQGAVMAIAGDRRSSPVIAAPHVRLVVAPTRTVRGKIDLGAMPATKTVAAILPIDAQARYQMIAPVARDGSFVITGAPIEPLRVTVLVGLSFDQQTIAGSKQVPAGTAPVNDVALAVSTSGRHLSLIIRSTLSTPLEQAMAVVATGRIRVTRLSDALAQQSMQRLDRHFARAIVGQVPRALAGRVKLGDLLAEFDDVPPGEATACALGLSRDLMANGPAKMFEHASELEIRCVPIPPEATSVVVVAPPPPRFD